MHSSFQAELESFLKVVDSDRSIITEFSKEENVEFTTLSIGSRRIIFWEDQWINQQDIIRSRISSLLGKTKRIHGRETLVVTLTKPEFIDFLVSNHLNVPVNPKYKFGLTHKSQLIAVAGFSKKCPIHRNGKLFHSHELVRHCNKLNYTVVGGLSKLIKHFTTQTDADDIVTQIDKEWSDGISYKNLGFKLQGVTQPKSFFVDSNNTRNYSTPTSGGFSSLKNQGNYKYLLPLKNA